MIAAWMTYSILVGSLLGVAALLAEHGLITTKLGGVRWVWGAACLGSMLAAVAVVIAPGGPQGSSTEIQASVDLGAVLGVSDAAAPALAAPQVEAASGDPGSPRGEGSEGTFAPGETAGAERDPIGATESTASGAHGREVEASVIEVSRSPPPVHSGRLPALPRLLSFPRLDRPLLALWAAASLFMLLRIVLSQVRLSRRRRGWRRERLDGTEVLISEDIGPAVVGILRSAVVIPEWAARAEPELLRLMLHHEREHLRAGDHRLLLLVATGLVLLPWNLPLWWQARRLRHAVEIDCDARVLRAGVRPRAYCELLLKVAMRRSPRLVAAPGLAEPSSYFERRVRILAMRRRSKWCVPMLASCAAAISITVLAWGVPPPASPLHAAAVRIAANAPPDGNTLSPPTAQLAYLPPAEAALADPDAVEEALPSLWSLDVLAAYLRTPHEELGTTMPCSHPSWGSRLGDPAGQSFSLFGRVPGLSAAILLLAGCAGGDAIADGAAVTRSDSAGIAIVETSRPAWERGGGWTLSPEPQLAVGRLEGEAPYLFGEVRGAVRLDDGSIVVIDGQARDLRWFDPTGGFVRSVGRAGEGPEEFPSTTLSLERCGPNLLYALDRLSRRILAWDTAGTFQRGFEFTDPGQPSRGVYAHACRDDGGFVAVGWGDFATMPTLPDGANPIFYRQFAPVWAFDSTGVLEGEYGEFLSSERIAHPRGTGPHPFGRAVKVAERGGRVFIGTGEGLSVGVYEDGRLVELWRAAADDLATNASFREAYANADVDRVRERDWIAQGLIELPPELPGFTDLQVTSGGYLWAKRFVLPWETGNRWGVFAPDGVFLGNVDLPVELTVLEIGDDYVLGVAADELDVQRVQLHALRR